MLLDEWERSGGSAAQFADYVGIKYSTLANWIQKRRKQAGLRASLLKPGAVDSNQSDGRWVEAILEKASIDFLVCDSDSGQTAPSGGVWPLN